MMSHVHKMYKLQSLINRFHATKYEKDLITSIKRKNELTEKYSALIENTDFEKYQYIENPMTEEDEIKNLYFKYEHGKVKSLIDEKARKS